MLYARTVTLERLGAVELVASDAGLAGVYFEHHRHRPEDLAVEPAPEVNPILDRAAIELAEYLAGTRRVFSVPLDPQGTPFQRMVWQALAAIPFGERRTYADLARAIGRPGAARAVGSANARNPISVFVPCHRVVGAEGKLTGYAGGLARKEWLLGHEARLAQGR